MALIEMYYKDRLCGVFNTITYEYTTWRRPEHYCIKYGWGIQLEITERLKKLGCKTVHIEYTNKEGVTTQLYTPFENYLGRSITTSLRAEDGTQVFVNKKLFSGPPEQAKNKPPKNRTLDAFK